MFGRGKIQQIPLLPERAEHSTYVFTSSLALTALFTIGTAVYLIAIRAAACRC